MTTNNRTGIEWAAPALGSTVADSGAALDVAASYGILEPVGERVGPGRFEAPAVQRFEPDAHGGFVKVPAEMVSRLIDGRVSMLELSDAIICGAILRTLETRGVSPTMTQICELTGSGWRQVAASCKRLEAAGMISARKRPYAYNANDYSARWEFSIPENSPAEALLKDSKGPADWRAVPLNVARDRSITAVAVWLVLSEQMRQDKCITTTPADLARALHTTSRTARRILEKVGARQVARRGRTRVYVMPGIFDKPTVDPVSAELELSELVAGVRGGEATLRLDARLAALRAALKRHRVDAPTLEAEAIAAVAASGVQPTRATIVRVLESLHLRVVMAEPRLSGAVTRSVAGRMKGLRRAERRRVSETLASATVQHIHDRAICSACNGEGLLEQADGTFSRCTACMT